MKTHRTDALSLTFGLVFLTVVAWWLVAQVVDLSLPNAGWFVAGALILLGTLGLVGALRGNNWGPPEQQGAGSAEATTDEATTGETTTIGTTTTDATTDATTTDLPSAQRE